MKKFAVIGSPIKHTRSPEIHYLFSTQTGIKISYEAIEVKPVDFYQSIVRLFSEGYDGLNITLPLKGLAYEKSDKPSSLSVLTEAANTLWMENGKIKADSTDGEGLKLDMQLKSLEVEGKKVLIIGAGGASKSILPSILSLKPKQVMIINRTKQKAEVLANKFNNQKIIVSGQGLQDVYEGFDGIINTSSHEIMGSKLDIDNKVFKKILWAYDLMYLKKETNFLREARAHGVNRSYDGLGMLICQAALSFQIWTGVKPNINTVLRKLF